jgi:hypothetical protein
MSRYSKTKEEYYLTFYGHHDSNEPDILFTITNPGTTNYTSIPTIAITTGVTNLGTGMRVTCTLTAGKITSVILLDKGVGYAGGTLTATVSGGGGAGATITAVFVYNKGYSRTSENLTAFDNCKRYRFNLNNLYSNVLLGFNAKVAIDLVAVPRSSYATTTPFKYVRICGVGDNVYDSERKGTNDPIIHINKANNLLTDITFYKNSRKFRIPPNFLSKGYVEFETGVIVSAPLTAHIRFYDADFVVSMVVYEDDFEESNDNLLAPPVQNQPPNKYFNNYYPNYNNT